MYAWRHHICHMAGGIARDILTNAAINLNEKRKQPTNNNNAYHMT